jgi:hypothetical protein
MIVASVAGIIPRRPVVPSDQLFASLEWENAYGVFRPDQPAPDMFRNLPKLSSAASLELYRALPLRVRMTLNVHRSEDRIGLRYKDQTQPNWATSHLATPEWEAASCPTLGQ